MAPHIELTKSITVYFAACAKHAIRRPNPILVQFFTNIEPILEDLEEIDLATNYVGNRGICALLDVIEQAPNFRTLDLSGQKLYNTDLSENSIKGNDVMERVIEVCRIHPSITTIDVSCNPISNYIGRKLLSLVEANHHICQLGMNQTRIDFDLRGKIKAQCEKNTEKLWDEYDDPMDESSPKNMSGGVEGEDSGAGGGEQEDGGFGTFGAFTIGGDSNTQQSPIQGGGGGSGGSKKILPNLAALGGGKRPRKTVMAAGLDMESAKSYKPPFYDKTKEQTDMICSLLQSNVLFAHLDSSDLRVISGSMQRREFQKGTDILTQNEEGNTLYVIESGSANILKEGQCVFVKAAGTAFGELELMYDAPCAATVRVHSDGGMICWALDRETYRYLVMGAAIRRREEHMKHVAAVPIFQTLSNYEKMQIADALSSNEWQPGEYIIQHEQEGECMFIILEGIVDVIGREHDKEKHVCEFNPGEFFGELEFLNNHKCVADVIAKTFVRTAKVNRRHFEMCMGPIKDILKRNTDTSKYEYYQKLLEKDVSL